MGLFDLIVRLTGDGQGLRDDIDEDIAKMEELRDSIQNKDMTVGVDAAQADEKLDAIKSRVQELRDVAMNITAEDMQANAKLDAVNIKAEELRNLTMQINVYDGPIAEAELEKLSVKAEELKLALADVPVKLLDSEAQLQLDELKAKLDSIHGKTVVVNVEEEQNGIPSTGVAGSKSGGDKKGKFNWGSVIASLLPVASPVAADTGGGFMGLLSALAPGAAGGAGFTALSATTLAPVLSDLPKLHQAQANATAVMNNPASTNAQKLAALQAEQAAIAGLDQAQVKALHDTQQFENTWKSFSAQFQKPILTAYTNTLQLIMQVMKSLTPAIKGFAAGLIQLQQDAAKALQSPFWKSFFNYLGGEAKASTLAFGKGLGNLAKGFAALLKAFNPLAQSMDTGWVKMTKSFADWASHLSATKGFQQFLDYVKQTGPQVLKLIGSLAELVGNLLTDMRPLGAVMLTVLNGLTGFLNSVLKVDPGLGTLIMTIISGIGAFKLLSLAVNGLKSGWVSLLGFNKSLESGLMSVARALGIVQTSEEATTAATEGMDVAMDANPIGAIIFAIEALIAVIVLLATNWKGTTAIAKEAWTALKNSLGQIWRNIATDGRQVWTSLATFFTNTWKSITHGLTSAWNNIVSFFKKYGLDILAALTGPVGVLVLFLVKNWATIAKDASTAWNAILGSLRQLWNRAITDAKQIWNGLRGVFTTLWKDIVQMFNSFVRDAEDFGKNLIQGIISGAEAMVRSAISAIGNVVNSIKSAIGLGNSQIAASVSSVSTLNVVHTGSVSVSGLTPRAVQQVNQSLYTTTIRR